MTTFSVPVSRDATLWRSIAFCIGTSLLMTLAAKVSIPFYPVPMTLQGPSPLCAACCLDRDWHWQRWRFIWPKGW